MNSPVIPHRLIMVVGSSPGAGKSTTSDFLYRALRSHNVPVEWFHEDDVFAAESVRRFSDQLIRGDPRAMNSFRESVEHFTRERRGDSRVHITDSYLPGFFWLLQLYPREQVETFANTVWEAVGPLDPLIIYCAADIPLAWRRAVSQRGAAWGENLVQRVASWPKPHYPATPIRDETDLLTYFSWLDTGCRELLTRWPRKVIILDTTSEEVSRIEAQLLRELDLDAPAPDSKPASVDFAEYVGTYVQAGEIDNPQHVVIELRGGSLFANLYWPAGSAIHPDGVDVFRLEANNRTLHFNRGADGRIVGFEYRHWSRTELYIREQYRAPESDGEL